MKNLLNVFFLFIKEHYFPFLLCAWGKYVWFDGNSFFFRKMHRCLTNIQFYKFVHVKFANQSSIIRLKINDIKNSNH